MIKKEEVYKIGMFNKPHGIHGELSFTFTDDVFDKAEKCDYLICLLDGILVPFFIQEYRFRSESTALVKLEDINSAEQARAFTNVEVFFPIHYKENEEEKSFSWDYFVGCKVYDKLHGLLGEVISVDTSTINTLFVVEYDQGELLIPAQEEFIEAVDQKERIIRMNLPEGLLDLENSSGETY